MNINEAIKSLTQLKKHKEEKEDHKEMKNHAEGMMGLKNILVTTMCELSKLMMSNKYQVTVSNFPKQDKIEKLLKEMNGHLIKIENKMTNSTTPSKIVNPRASSEVSKAKKV